ncbi:DeoR/GlpR family DNA-binding transcription regulator [Streptomyces mayteni]
MATDPSAGEGARRNPELRRVAIRRQVSEAGFVRVSELAAGYGVSIMTVHRDLDELARRGFLHKVRGGATCAPTTTFHGDLDHRMRAQVEAKEAIAREVLASEVRPGQVVALDDSTTSLMLARLLPERAPLTVVTHFLPVLRALAAQPGIELVGLGGRYDAAYDSFLGQATAREAAGHCPDVLFLSTTAVARGVCRIQSRNTMVTRRALIASAARSVALIDHSKFDRQAPYRLAAVAELDRVVVDAATPEPTVRELRARGGRIDVVEIA